jgi:cyclase
MVAVRIIARLDVKSSTLIKGIHLEGLRVLGDPRDFARRYYREGIDEVVYMDVVASLYGRNHLADIVRHTATDVFVPLTVGGGIRSVDDVRELLRAGADKVAVNTAAVKRPALLSEIAGRFGSQCLVLSIEAKNVGDGRWEVFTDNGRERTGLDAVEWAVDCVGRGVGEILVTGVDREGTRRGFDVRLVREISSRVSVPVIASGGMGTTGHLVEVVRDGMADAVAIADALHYNRIPLRDMRTALEAAGVEVRKPK